MKALIDVSREINEANVPTDLLVGLKAAANILMTETPYQSRFRTKSPASSVKKMSNERGRIVCVSYFRSEKEIKCIQEAFAGIVEEIGLSFVDLVLLNTHPMNRPTNVAPATAVRVIFKNCLACCTCSNHVS